MNPDKLKQEVSDDKSQIYQATIADKQLLLLKCHDLYEAGKNRNEQLYFDTRSAILDIVYSIQEDTAATITDEMVERFTKLVANAGDNSISALRNENFTGTYWISANNLYKELTGTHLNEAREKGDVKNSTFDEMDDEALNQAQTIVRDSK